MKLVWPGIEIVNVSKEVTVMTDHKRLAHILGRLAESLRGLPTSPEQREVSQRFLALCDHLEAEGLVPERPDRVN